MKEVIGKGKLVNNSLPKHLILNNRNIFDQKTIANSFNEYFVNVGIFLIKKPLPIASMNILPMLDQN